MLSSDSLLVMDSVLGTEVEWGAVAPVAEKVGDAAGVEAF